MGKRKTHEEFVEELALAKPNIKVIGTYKSAREKIEFQCLIDNYIWEATPDNVLRKTGCPECSKLLHIESNKKRAISHEDFIEECKIINPNIEIISKYTKSSEPVDCKCLICGGTYTVLAARVKEGRGCPICAGLKIQIGINDIATTNPEIVKFFKNTEDVYTHTRGMNKKCIFQCPDCKYEAKRQVCDVVKYGFSCPKCADGVSYPNKFSRSLLEQLPVQNIQYEYSPKWANGRRYDNYFEYNNQKYILEMDGGFHFIKYYKSNLPIDETKRIDVLKDKLAKENNINVIRINCLYSDPTFIINNILASQLSVMFDLTKIDWVKCKINASKNLVKVICDYYNEHKEFGAVEIGRHFNINQTTITRYLCMGTEIGFCEYKRPMKNKSKPIILYNETESLSFPSRTKCRQYLKSKYKTMFSDLVIINAIANNSLLHDYYVQYV